MAEYVEASMLPERWQAVNLECIKFSPSVLLLIWVLPKIEGTTKWMVYHGNPY